MTIRQIYQLYKKYHTPLHVQKHMESVEKIAVAIAQKIKKNGYKVNVAHVRQIALLHDLMKVIVFKNFNADSFMTSPTKADLACWKKLQQKYSTHDAEATASILQDLQESRLAEAVVSQQFDAVTSKTHPLKTLEEKIVYYADKRVAHTTLVPLHERLREGYRRYSRNKKKTKRVEQIELAIHMLEEEILSMVGEKL